ncbi:MAG TPA: hypothetical protein VJY35_16315 [Candidatus Eisenbacteria bacterium]|nr:hypothetical protein [Candidatus Eisenbacteria bacterium]
MPSHRNRTLAVWFALFALAIASVAAAEDEPLGLPPEVPDDPPGIPAQPLADAKAATIVSFGRFTHYQVNVSAGGANIPGDAANEPSIAVHPFDHNLMAIGWRQFDTVSSNFRQAGFGYTTNAGLSWTAGKINPGVFRSDPVLAVDAEGDFFYNSLMGNLTSQVFPSTNAGQTWGASVSAFGGDKQWMTVDRTGGVGNNFFYQAWSTASNPTPPNTFNRSINDGASWQSPVSIPSSPVWGTLDVASDGTLYIVGTEGPGGAIYVSRSTNAKNSGVTPTFTTTTVDLGGTILTGAPNPAGLLGQLWIGVDRSNGPRAGWVYVLASVERPFDPLDVMFIRSTDGGQTWSTPVRVNGDPGTSAFQWFGTMSVAPNGRIDAVWNDTRGSLNNNVSALYYSFSLDGGVTWSANEQASPTWSSNVGYPNQSKIGDYYHMVSDNTGADLAWAATFNNEQDVYYVRLSPPGAVAVEPGVAPAFRLHAGLPNPFTAFTDIRFDVPPGGARVALQVFDLTGHRVATLVDGFREGGAQQVRWAGRDDSGRDVVPGVYLYRYATSGHAETRKLILLR